MTEKTNADVVDVEDVDAEEQPVFDWEGITYEALRQYDKAVSDLADLNIILSATFEAKQNGSVSAQKRRKQKFQKAQMEALSNIEMVQANRDSCLRDFIISLPQSWLVRGAPDVIPEGQHLKYMQSRHMIKLNTELHRQNAGEQEDIKN